MDDDATAIDDSGATQLFGRPPPISRSDAGYGSINFEYGRRSGYWTAGETVFESAIDDVCPTVVHLPRAYRGGGETGHVQPLSSAVLKKLKKASEEDEKRKAAARAEEEVRENEKAVAAAEHPRAAPEVKAPPKCFYIPERGLGIKIVSKDGKSEVVMRPQSITKATVQPSNPKTEAEKVAGPAPTVIPEAPQNPEVKAPSATSRSTGANHRRVKIVGKNGEEAFVELPAFQITSKPKPHVYIPAHAEVTKMRTADPPAGTPKKSKEDKAKQEQKAAKAARELRTQRERQEKEEKEQRERQAKAVAEVLMSGGLDGSHKSSLAASSASMHTFRSASSRSASVINGVFDNNSNAPSKASSRTMAPPPAKVASERAASQASGQRAKTTSVNGRQSNESRRPESQKPMSTGGWAAGGARSAASAQASQPQAASVLAAVHTSNQRSRAPSQWQALGSGVKGPPQTAANEPWDGRSEVYKTPPAAPQSAPSQAPPQQAGSRQKASTPPSRPASITSSQISRKIANIQQWNNATPSVHTRLPSHHDQPSVAQPPAPLSINSRRANNASQDTIFAGAGWISPHPLSRAPTEFEPPPQDQISIAGATMTYEEWRRLQQQTNVGGELGRRNFSRTSSEGRTMRGGAWGHGPVPASLGGEGDGSVAAGSGGYGWGQGYHVPTVISEHSEHSHQSHHTQHSASHVQCVRSGSQQSGASSGRSNMQNSFSDSLPGVGSWGAQPQVDGAGSFSGGLGRTWRQPERTESSFMFRSLENGGDERGSRVARESVQLSMPWDREAVLEGKAR